MSDRSREREIRRTAGERTLHGAACLLSILLALAASAGGCSMSTARGAEAKLPGSSWVAEAIAGGGVLDRVQSTLEFGEDGRVSGNAACNRLTGSVIIDGQKLSFAKMATTRRMCPPPVMEQEQRFLTTLAAVRRFEVAQGKLLLYGISSAVLIRLAPLEPGS